MESENIENISPSPSNQRRPELSQSPDSSNTSSEAESNEPIHKINFGGLYPWQQPFVPITQFDEHERYRQSAHGTIRRQPQPHSHLGNPKRYTSEKDEAKHVCPIFSCPFGQQSEQKRFEHIKQYRSIVETDEKSKYAIIHVQQENDDHSGENQLNSEVHEKSEPTPFWNREISTDWDFDPDLKCKAFRDRYLTDNLPLLNILVNNKESTASEQQYSKKPDKPEEQLTNDIYDQKQIIKEQKKPPEYFTFQNLREQLLTSPYITLPPEGQRQPQHDQCVPQSPDLFGNTQTNSPRIQKSNCRPPFNSPIEPDKEILDQNYGYNKTLPKKIQKQPQHDLYLPLANDLFGNSQTISLKIQQSNYGLLFNSPVGSDIADPDHNNYCESFAFRPESYILERHPSPTLRNNPSNNDLTQDYYNLYYMERMGSLEDHERKVIIEFCHLLEKSKQLFNGLRELPHYGHKQWHSYFGRTFDVYTKLWKFQQQHRAVLDSKYGMKRWQIGEIASKIGQLYYHFYLRTSETAYLNEAFSFYYAIRGRSYYTKACKEDKCELVVKKLRYYARFIVVCLLLKKVKLVRELTKELEKQIIEYGNTYDPDDQIEWTVVVDEVKAFIQAEPIVSVIHPDNYPVILSHRLSPLTTPPIERTSQMNLSLQEVLIVGNSSHQVKFSELTMDMFRMLQTLEREPTGDIQHMYDDSPRQRFNLTPSAFKNKGYNLESGAQRSENPHKYLLFKPSPSQILVYLASGCNDLPPNGALLLYISADGQIIQPSKHSEDGYDIGGVLTTSKNELYRDGNKEKGNQVKNKELQYFHPGDLNPFTRRPLFVIIDSENSYMFQNIPRHFGQPLVVLMSPIELPSSLHASTLDRRQQGSLFTLFLHSPLTAFCHCCDIHTISLVHWDRALTYIDTFLAEASQLATRNRIDPMFLNFMNDDFLRLLITRFIFCEVVLRMHRAIRARNQLTRSSPAISEDILEHPALTHIVMDLASHLQVRGTFHDPSTSGPPPPKE